MQERSAFNPALVREKLLVTIAVAVIVTTLFIVFSGDDLRPLFSNWTINISAGTALAMALVASLRQGTGGLYGRTTVAFTAGPKHRCRSPWLLHPRNFLELTAQHGHRDQKGEEDQVVPDRQVAPHHYLDHQSEQ